MIVSRDIAKNDNADLGTMTTEQLHDELVRSLSVTVGQVVRMAEIVRLLEERGEDLSDLRIGLIGYLRRIAYGQVLPEIIVRYHGLGTLLSRAAAMPIPDQERLIRDDRVVVADIAPDGSVSHRMVPPTSLSFEQINQVFGRDQMRSLEDQVLYLRDRASRRRIEQRSGDGVVLNQRRHGIEVNGYFISCADLADYLARLTKK